jgi:hypothetical protein
MLRPHCKHMVNGGSVGPRRECKNRAMAGSEYCSRHANHPARQVEDTKASLTEYVDAAIKSLGRIVTDGAKPWHERPTMKDSDVIKAAVAILDRTGNGPTSTVTIQDSDDRLNAIISERRRALEDREA